MLESNFQSLRTAVPQIMATCRPIIPWPVFILTDESGTPYISVEVDAICVLPGGRGCIVCVTVQHDHNRGRRYLLHIRTDGEIEVLADDSYNDGYSSFSVSILSDGLTLLMVSEKGPL